MKSDGWIARTEKLRASKAQREMLDAMKQGVRVFRMSSPQKPYFYIRTDTGVRCTQTAYALIDKGLARLNENFELVLIA